MPRIAAIIRLCYPPGRVPEENKRWRFQYFREAVLPRLVDQTDVWVWTWSGDRNEVESWDNRIGTFGVDERHPGAIQFENTVLTGHPWAAVKGLPPYDHQLLLGSDDLISPFFAEEIVRRYRAWSRVLISVEPIFYDVRTKKSYRREKPLTRPSPILVMKQRIGSPNYTWVWADDHRKLGRLVQPLQHLSATEGLAVMTLHDYNDGTRVSRTMIEWPTPGWVEGTR